jgi:lipid-A-disaccharide synthase-like uncharacterized protein
MAWLTAEQAWWAFGFVGEVFFGLRFLVQWIATERRRKSVVPVAFWYMSLLGAAILLSYAIHRRDPVFIAGIAPTIPIYLRNLYFIRRSARAGGGDAAA